MYKVLKPKGLSSHITVENTVTKASVIIGGISIQILNILKDAGFQTEEHTLVLPDEWNFEVNIETANKLANTALKMKKPVRTKKTEEKIEEKTEETVTQLIQNVNKHIDAVDVLLGLAEYV